jgi:predicted site-specific integrase-resolvase
LLKRKNVLYARVSNTKQKDDLERQKQILRQFMASNGFVVDEEYSDIASGMNESRAGFTKLVKECLEGKIDTIFVTYKDRLTRFGFGYIESILSSLGTKIVIINATKEEDFQQELTQDLVSIIHHFSMKMYSNRRKILKEVEEKIKNI